MKKAQLNRLKGLLKVQSSYYDESRMKLYIIQQLSKLKNIKAFTDEIGNIYVVKDDNTSDYFPCIVSHIDTVHNIVNNVEIVEQDGALFAIDLDTKTQIGTGGDDKVGIFACLEMLRISPKIKVAFFVQEEIGCIGSNACHLPFFDDVRFIIQCDRKGNSDVVKFGNGTELFSSEFESNILPFLFKNQYNIVDGGLTDVVKLKELGITVSCINISCGYYFPHTLKEYVVIKDVHKCLNLVQDIFKLEDKKWYHFNEPEENELFDENWEAFKRKCL